jgi:putative transposase
MATALGLTRRTIAERFREVKDEEGFWGDVQEETKALVKRLLESSLEEDLIAQLGAHRYERAGGRTGWRNGHYTRWLVTRWGIIDVHMPRARQKLKPPAVLARYQRSETAVADLIRQVFLRGVSTREVGAVLQPLLGWKPSAQTVSRVAVALDREVRRFHWRTLDDSWRYLLLDGLTMKVKHPGGVSKKLVLVAYGMRVDGTRQILDFRLATAESAAQWEAFLADLFRRGVEGTQLALVVTDGAPGLRAALELVYPRARHQRCWVHKLRNLANKVPKKHQAACLGGAKRIYQAPNAREAGHRFQAWASDWREILPKAVLCLEQDLEELLNFFQCPKADWRAIRTTNAIERSFREVRRRTRPMTCFQNNASCERIIYAIITHLNEQWSTALPAPHNQFTQRS